MPESHRVNTLPSSQPILRFPGHEHPDLPLHAGVNGLCRDPDHDRALMITPGGGSSLIEFCVDARGLWLHVAEGVRCAQTVRTLAQQLGVDMPIAEAVASVLFDGVSAQEMIARLLSRDAKQENH